MRIISPFKDYYDNVVNDISGRVWVRETFSCTAPRLSYDKKTLLGISSALSSDNKLNKKINNPLSLEQSKYIATMLQDLPNVYYNAKIKEKDQFFILCLCGVMYYFVIHKSLKQSWVNGNLEIKTKDIIYNNYDEYDENHKTRNKYFFERTLSFMDWLRKYKDNPINKEILLSFKSPIFIIDSSRILPKGELLLIINPLLKNYNLQAIFNPFNIYQDLDRFINNDLVMYEPCDINLSDDLMRDSKGFDKHSFRQVGPKKRKQKK